MKKFITFIFALMLSLNVKAQTSLTEAVDFTAVECYGQDTINLFEILDRGQYVLIDFYFYNCDPCYKACPHVVDAYKALGCNKHDVFFMEITHSDDDEICQWWAEKHGVEYPTISKTAGGFDIVKTYGIPSFPTFVLIAPDRQILLNDIDCFEIIDYGYQVIVDALAPFGIEEHSCDEEPITIPEKPMVVAEAVSIDAIEVSWNKIENATHYNLYEGSEVIAENLNDTIFVVSNLMPKTEYCFSVTAANEAGESEHSENACDTTLSNEGLDEMLTNDFDVYPNPATSEITITSELNGETDVRIYDMTGRCVKNIRVDEINNTTIDISDIDKGVYFINVNGQIEKLLIR